MDSDLALRLSIGLLISAVLGGLIGAERELHAHPAGMRTHLLVAVGCTLFTQISIYGFTTDPAVPGIDNVDPSRVAAQIVTGIGFIGAGAILKYGTSIRGLTTAASLWVTAAIGMGVGTGQFVLATVATAIVLLSLWPLDRIAHWLRSRQEATFRASVLVRDIEAIGAVASTIREARIAIDSLVTQRKDATSIELDLELRLPGGMSVDQAVALLVGLPSVEVLQAERSIE